MNKPAFTHGPWYIKDSVIVGQYLVGTKDGEIAIVNGLSNTKFIQAAPDMYELHKFTLSYLESFREQWQEGEEMLWSEITNVLAKAEGGTPNEAD